MTARVQSRFGPYVRWVLGGDIEILSQEGSVSEVISADRALFLASQLLQAVVIVQQGEQRPPSVPESASDCPVDNDK